jgi:hypothetical protein
MAQAPTFTASTTDFLLNAPSAPGSSVGTDTFILQINGFSENGVAIPVPGLGTSFGLYIEGTVTVQATPSGGSVYGPGTISLVLDPTNNDGTPAAVWDTTTETGLVGFSNPENTLNDITLATGNFVSGSFGVQSNGQDGVNFVQTFDLNPQVFGPLLSDLASSLDINETLFNTATSRYQGTISPGVNYVTSNDGYGIVSLTTASPVSDSSPSFYCGDTAGRSVGELGTLASSDGSGGLDLRALADEILADLGVTLPGSFLPEGRSGPWDFVPGNSGAGTSHHFDVGGGLSSNLPRHDSQSASH